MQHEQQHSACSGTGWATCWKEWISTLREQIFQLQEEWWQHARGAVAQTNMMPFAAAFGLISQQQAMCQMMPAA
jgi:hypothetical protein